MFPYHLGVAKCLEMEGFLASDTPLAGTSAGCVGVGKAEFEKFNRWQLAFLTRHSCLRVLNSPLGLDTWTPPHGILTTIRALLGYPLLASRALTAAVVGCGLDIDTASELSNQVFDDCRSGGTAFRLK